MHSVYDNEEYYTIITIINDDDQTTTTTTTHNNNNRYEFKTIVIYPRGNAYLKNVLSIIITYFRA